MKEFIDIIVNIIIGLVLIWSFLSKLRKKDSPESDDDKTTQPKRFKEVIGEIIADLSETDSAKTSLIADHKGWERIPSEKPLPEPAMQKVHFCTPLKNNEIVRSYNPLSLYEERKKANTLSDEKKIPDSETKRPIPQKRLFSIKKAVIWSEILAPPLGLRE